MNQGIRKVVAMVAYLIESRGIGFQGKLPWESNPIKSDMKRFKELTLGHIVIMGRKTWESFPEKSKPLPGRINIIISRTLTIDDVPTGVLIFKELEEAIAYAQWIDSSDDKKIYILGGGEVYEEAMVKNLLNIIEATVVHAKLEYDKIFPPISYNWENINQTKILRDPQSEIDIQFITLRNMKNP